MMLPLADALAAARELRRRLKFARGALAKPPRVHIVGSIRRGDPTIYDIDLLVEVPDGVTPADLLTNATLRDAKSGLNFASEISSGPRKRSFVVTKSGRPVQVDLFLAHSRELPFALFHYTGSRNYNIRTRAHAKARGWRLNQYGLFDSRTGRRVRGSGALRTERELAALLGVSYRAPSDRAQ